MTLLQTVSLTKQFGVLTAVKEVDLIIEAGPLCAVIGPNGAGKTTLFNLLSGTLMPTSGKILFEGANITNLPPFRRCQLGMGRSFQKTSLFPHLTVLENVRVAAQARMPGAGRLFKSVRSLRFALDKALAILNEVSLEASATAVVSTLSHGDLRTLEVAVSLAGEPGLLLLDEPTSGLSSKETESMMNVIARIAQQVTVVLIEHKMDVVMSVSDRIVVLHQGAVIADGTPEEIRTDKRVQQAYLGSYSNA